MGSTEDVNEYLKENFISSRKVYLKALDEFNRAGLLLKTAWPSEYERLMNESAIPVELEERITTLQLSVKQKEEYLKIKKAGDRIVYLISALGRAVKAKAIEKMILEIEGPAMAKKTTSSFPQKLKYLVYDGKLVLAKYSGSNKYGFYILPEWKSKSVKVGISPLNAPLPHEFESLSAENRDPRKIEWSEKKR